MTVHRFSTLRRLLDCPAQYLLADQDMDTPEIELGRAGHMAMQSFATLLEAIPTPSPADEQRVMDAVATRVLLADPRKTDALREALRALPTWYRIPTAGPDETVLIEQPIHVVLEHRMPDQKIISSRPATVEEIAAGSPTNGWLYRATVDYAVFLSQRSGRKEPSVIVDWKFDQGPEAGDPFHRELQRRLYALAAWIVYGWWGSQVEVQTVYPFLRKMDSETYGPDQFIVALADLESLLIRAHAVTQAAPAKVSHARPGPRCATCLVSHVCPAADATVLEMRRNPAVWVGRAEDWILLRRRATDLEAYLREKTRAEGPITTSSGFEVGFRGGVFGVYSTEGGAP